MIELILSQLQSIGGPVIVLLILLSVAAAAITFVKIIEFARMGVGRHGPAREAVRLWETGDRDGALRQLDGESACLPRVLSRVMQAAQDPNLAPEAVREDGFGFALDLLTRLRRHLRTLDTIVQAAPMLGLLGTVLGMIDAFGKLELGGGSVDPSQLAGGIWVALLTTALGLIVAIPFYFVTTWLEGRIERERVAMETAMAMLLARNTAGAAAGLSAGSAIGARAAAG
ncbi:MAG: MotA/TolQ/ExbB proton channel family protein [Pseudomonadota bacterium]